MKYVCPAQVKYMPLNKPVLNKIQTIKNLPTLPHILLKLIEACNREDIDSFEEVANIVDKDPSLSSKILRMVNSAYYGMPNRVEGVEKAVALVGINAVKNIAICASVFETFDKTQVNTTFSIKLFWWHSLKCAVIARLIAKKTLYGQPDEAFLSGLLHDIGKLILHVNFAELFAELTKTYKNPADLLTAAEIKLGVTHHEVGAWLLQKWKLQSFLVDSVFY